MCQDNSGALVLVLSCERGGPCNPVKDKDSRQQMLPVIGGKRSDKGVISTLVDANAREKPVAAENC